MQKNNKARIFILGWTIFLVFSASEISAIELFEDNKPQSTTDSCQSYSAVLALASINDPIFPINNFEELRAAELGFRTILESLPGDPELHTNWPEAMKRFTSNRYTFKLEYVKELSDWVNRARSQTRSYSSLSNVIGSYSQGEVVLTSVTGLAGSVYGGHIVSVLGVSGTGMNSNTRVMAFNSAIKGQGDSINRCSPGDQPGDYLYKAGVIETKDFNFRDFGSGFLFMTLERT